MIVAGVIVSGLLYVVVELLQIDRRESVLAQTQQDMQRALDYIADDIKEAVYLYEDPTTVTAQLTDLPTGTPILAFWRPDAIDTNLPNCSTWAAGTTTFEQCEVLKVRQSAYSLVVYLQKERDTNANWSGESRIIRYELDKYSDLSNLTVTTGYQDPASSDVDFSTWTRDGSTTDGASAVLVDFVDSPTSATAYNKSPLSDSCNSLGTEYTIVPSTATTTTNTSFFGCIRDPDPTVSTTAGNANQDAYLFLRGSIDGAGGALNIYSTNSSLPTLETRVLMRGVIDKNPVN
ncbi:MAG: prepilin-type cleavage/methylation domain-containing protein [Cyanobacteria bacterium P01_F01_bin.86]